MPEHNSPDLIAPQAPEAAFAMLIVHLKEDGFYSTHPVPVSPPAFATMTAAQKKRRALNPRKTRLSNRLLLRKVVVDRYRGYPAGT